MSEDPVAIVTGGAQGLGAAICKQLLEASYRVCIADIQEDKLKEVTDLYDESYVIVSHCDVSKESDFIKTFELTLKTFQRVDVLINNAGIGGEQNPRRVLDVNLMGPMIGCQLALKYMGKSNGGQGGMVINIASTSGFVPCSAMPAYVSSKHGVVGLTRCYGLPYHLDKDGVTFAALCPYFIDTPLLKHSSTGLLYPGLDFSKRTDLLSPAYVAKGAIKLLKDRINGSTLIVMEDGYHYVRVPEEFKNIPVG